MFLHTLFLVLLLFLLLLYRDDRLPPRRNVDEEKLQIFADAAIDAVADAIVIRICSSDADLFFFSRFDIFLFSLEPLSVDTWVWTSTRLFDRSHKTEHQTTTNARQLDKAHAEKKQKKFGSRLSSLLETFLRIRT
jgi:hypothetical protein